MDRNQVKKASFLPPLSILVYGDCAGFEGPFGSIPSQGTEHQLENLRPRSAGGKKGRTVYIGVKARAWEQCRFALMAFRRPTI